MEKKLMKRLIVLIAFMPFAATGQHFEISEMIGYSKELTNVFGELGNNVKGNGLSNDLAVNYYPIKKLSVGICYENNIWKPSNYLIGIISEIHLRYFYFGMTVSQMNFETIRIPNPYGSSPILSFTSALGYSAHAGLTEKITKHIKIKEQIQFCYTSTAIEWNNVQQRGDDKQPMDFISALAGIAYNF